MQYRKIPVVIDAVEWDGALSTLNKIAEMGGVRKVSKVIGDQCLIIETLEGQMKGNIGDFIIKGVKGELYPCKPDIFRMTYEKYFREKTTTKTEIEAGSFQLSFYGGIMRADYIVKGERFYRMWNEDDFFKLLKK